MLKRTTGDDVLTPNSSIHLDGADDQNENWSHIYVREIEYQKTPTLRNPNTNVFIIVLQIIIGYINGAFETIQCVIAFFSISADEVSDSLLSCTFKTKTS